MSRSNCTKSHVQDLTKTLHVLSFLTTGDHDMKIIDQSLYYQKAEDLWRTAILLSKDFSSVNAANSLKWVLNQNHRQKLKLPEPCDDDCNFVTNGKQRRAMDGIGIDKRVRSPVPRHQNPSGPLDTKIGHCNSEVARPDTIVISMCGLSGILVQQKKYLDEEWGQLFTLNWPRELVLTKQPSILTGLHDLAKISMIQNKDEQAEEILRYTIQRMETELETDDLEIMEAFSNLALVLIRRGDLDEAEAMYRKTLRTMNKILIWDNCLTQETLSRLVTLLTKRRKFREASELKRSYGLPESVKSIMLAMFPKKLEGLHIGIIDDHHDDDDVRSLLQIDILVAHGIRVRPGDGSIAVELILDPEDLRVAVVVSLGALMGSQTQLRKAIKHCLTRAMTNWRDTKINTFVCCIDQDKSRNTRVLPHYLSS